MSIGPRDEINSLGSQSKDRKEIQPGSSSRTSLNPLYLLYFIPKNLLSFLTGLVVRVKFPKIFQYYINRGFVGLFGINTDEASLPLADYACIEDLFTRTLKPNSRIISGQYVSSADGRVEMSRPFNGKEAIQAKGLSYRLDELIFGAPNDPTRPQAHHFSAAWYTTVYLAPHNYHRVHSPFAGKLVGLRHIPGDLWPVNRRAVALIPKLFIRNERLVFDFALDGGARAWLVMVGAFNVGRMETRLYPGFVTNSLGRILEPGAGKRELTLPEQGVLLKVGDELGVFMLGSTTVVVLDEKAKGLLKPREILQPENVLMGQSLS